MFIKYDIDCLKEMNLKILQNEIYSFSYTELDNEPSFLHSHSFTEIILPQTDYCRLILPQENLRMKKDLFYIVNPHIMHTEMKLVQSNKAGYYAVKIDGTIVKNDLQAPYFIVDPNDDRSDLNNYLNAAKRHFDIDNVRLGSLELLGFFLVFNQILEKNQYRLTKEKEQKTSGIISEIKHYFSNSYGKNLKINDVCEEFGISHNSLLVKFKKELGMTPKEYLNEKRLNAAVYLLSNTDLSISQISTLCGFDSASYFTYIFKRNMNLTPKLYRDSLTEQKKPVSDP